MVHMSSVVKWGSRAGAAVTGAVLMLLIPVQAWAASTGVADVAVEAARYRRRGGGFGLIAGLCCLVVVAAVVLAVFLISRNRRRK